MSKLATQVAKTVAHANVKAPVGNVPVRFIKTGKVYRATSRGLPRLALTVDESREQVIVMITTQGSQSRVRVPGTDLGKAFSEAVKNCWH